MSVRKAIFEHRNKIFELLNTFWEEGKNFLKQYSRKGIFFPLFSFENKCLMFETRLSKLENRFSKLEN